MGFRLRIGDNKTGVSACLMLCNKKLTTITIGYDQR